LLLILALQAAAPAPAAAPERFSILAPPPPACRSPGPASDDIVVCATAESARLPLPDERGPPARPRQSNPDLDGQGALAGFAPVCAARQAGCQVGVDVLGAGTAAIRLVQKLVAPGSCCEDPGEGTNAFKLVGDTVGGIGKAFARKPEKANRVPIDLADPGPPPRARP
jgi:hypothetical protein